MPLEHWPGGMQVVGVSVVERDGHARSCVAPVIRRHVFEPDDAGQPRQNFQLLRETNRAHRELPRVHARVRDAVIHEYQRLRVIHGFGTRGFSARTVTTTS